MTGVHTIDPATSLGTVVLTVADLDMQAAFYRDAIGLRPISRVADTVELGVAEGDAPLVTLVGSPDAPPRPPGTTGLFHLALLVPSRPDLARAMRRVTDAGHRFTGASDHLVSEALYLDDPEGNGIELYRDRPRAEWRHDDGELQMATLPLDVEGVLASATDTVASAAMPAGTRIGHVHLQVADLDDAEAFYVGGVGFDMSVRRLPGALFVSAGGYHHHVGLNTWAGRGAPAPPAGARGLRSFTIVVPDERSLVETRTALIDAGRELTSEREATVVADPSGNRLALVSS